MIGKIPGHHRLVSIPIVAFAMLGILALPVAGQLPFYTDDPAVTERGKFHFEFFDEYDFLQREQFPNLRQNTANYKLNYGLPHDLELDLDAPYLAIFRSFAVAPATANGIGDLDLGVKWNFHKESGNSRVPALSASLYIEFPTGDTRRQLGSGLTDYALNFIGQRHLSEKTRLTANTGILFAGNTSTGVIGIDTTRGRVYTGGLSLIHDVNSRWTLGGEVYGGLTSNLNLGRSQVQVLVGGNYAIRNGLALAFGLLGGKYIASPRIGVQLGFAVDFPQSLH
jgi:hypothetical protein